MQYAARQTVEIVPDQDGRTMINVSRRPRPYTRLHTSLSGQVERQRGAASGDEKGNGARGACHSSSQGSNSQAKPEEKVTMVGSTDGVTGTGRC
jgi:hypothetical protein